MPHVAPPKVNYEYRISTNPDGSYYIGKYEDGTRYYNILAVRMDGGSHIPQRIIARTSTLENAQRLVQSLIDCTA